MANSIPPPPSEEALFGGSSNVVPPPPPEHELYQQNAKFYELEKQPGLPGHENTGFVQNAKDFALHAGKQAFESLTSPIPGSMLNFPIKAAQENASMIGNDVAKGLSNKGGLLPDIGKPLARLAGFGASIVADPTSFIGGGEGAKVAKTVAEGTSEVVGKQGAQIASGVSNVPIRSIVKFFKDPMAVFKAPSSKEAGVILQKAKELAGVTREEEFLIAKAADRATGGARTVAEELRPRFEGTVKDAAPLSVGELIAFNRAVGKLAGEAKGSEKFLYGQLKQDTQKALEKQATGIAEALETYALSKTKNAFKSIVPLTKQGRADYLKTIGAGLTFGLTSPFAIGAGTLAAKGLNKAVKFGAPATGFALGTVLSESSKRALDQMIKDKKFNAH